MADARTGKGWESIVVAALAIVLMVFGGIGVVSGQFWLPGHRMKRSVDGPGGRVLGGLALIGGVALLIRTIFYYCEPDDPSS